MMHGADRALYVGFHADGQQPLENDGEDDEMGQDDSLAGNELVEDAQATSAKDVLNVREDAVRILRKHASETLAVDASPTDKNLIASGGRDDIAILWDIEQGTPLVELDGAEESVSTVAFSNDGKYVATGSENGDISVMFLQGAYAPQAPLEGPGEAITFLAWHPRGPVLLAGSEDKVAYMWNASRGLFMMAFVGHEDAITCGFFSRDGKRVVTASRDSSVRVWNPASGATVLRIQAGQPGIGGTFHGADIHCLSMGYPGTPLSSLVASGCAAGRVYVSNVDTGQVLVQLPTHEGGVESVAFSPPTLRPMLLASAGADGIIRVRDMEAGVERCIFTHPQVIAKLQWHPDRPLLVSASSEGTLRLWNPLSGQQLAELSGHTSYITDFCFAASNEFIASVSEDESVRIFDIRPFL